MRFLVATSLSAAVMCLCACGSTTTTTTTTAGGKVVVSCHIRFAKTRFVLHAGVASAGFYRYIYKPYRVGAFRSGAPGRRKALAKAAAAAAVSIHELKVAAKDARCDGAALKRLASPLNTLLAQLDTIKGIETAGGLGSIAAAQAALTRLRSGAADAGAPLKQP